MKIRAAVLERFGAPLEVQELELAEPKAGEVLVRLVACGVCHTDLYTASGASKPCSRCDLSQNGFVDEWPHRQRTTPDPSGNS